MNRRIITIVAASSLAITSPSAVALAQSPGATAAQPQRTAGPTVAASTAGIRPSATSTAVPSTQQGRERSLGAGQNVALIVVGGAALVIGAIIGGTAGILLAVGGAVLGLYGLYNYVR